MRFPTPDLQQRLLGNGGRVPSGLFRPNYYRQKRRGGIGGPSSLAAAAASDPVLQMQLEALRAMLRDLTNINVRQPSHMAPPFRATQFLFQTYLQASNAEPVTIPINGNSAVPVGTNAVIYWIDYSLGAGFNTTLTVPGWGETGANQLPVTIYKNSQAIPGLSSLLPRYTMGVQLTSGADFLVQQRGPAAVPLIPVTLQQGDALAFTNDVGGTGEAYLQIAGYTYPIEVDGDGIRGTLADRG